MATQHIRHKNYSNAANTTTEQVQHHNNIVTQELATNKSYSNTMRHYNIIENKNNYFLYKLLIKRPNTRERTTARSTL